MDFQLIDREAFQIAGLKKSLQFDDEFSQLKEIHRFWSLLDQEGILDQLIGFNNGEIKGLIGATVDVNAPNDFMDYWAGVHFRGNTGEDFMNLELPASKWAVFEVVGPFTEAVPEMWKKIYSTWLPTSGYEVRDAPSLEVYKTLDPNSPRARSELWVPLK